MKKFIAFISIAGCLFLLIYAGWCCWQFNKIMGKVNGYGFGNTTGNDQGYLGILVFFSVIVFCVVYIRLTLKDLQDVSKDARTVKQYYFIWAINFFLAICMGTWFYWTKIRPENIRLICTEQAQKAVNGMKNVDIKTAYKGMFDMCENEYGLKH